LIVADVEVGAVDEQAPNKIILKLIRNNQIVFFVSNDMFGSPKIERIRKNLDKNAVSYLTKSYPISMIRLTHPCNSVTIPAIVNANKSVRFFNYYYFYGTENQTAVGGA